MADTDTPSDEAGYGWQSDLPSFYGTPPRVVRLKLEQFIRETFEFLQEAGVRRLAD